MMLKKWSIYFCHHPIAGVLDGSKFIPVVEVVVSTTDPIYDEAFLLPRPSTWIFQIHRLPDTIRTLEGREGKVSCAKGIYFSYHFVTNINKLWSIVNDLLNFRRGLIIWAFAFPMLIVGINIIANKTRSSMLTHEDDVVLINDTVFLFRLKCNCDLHLFLRTWVNW